MKKQQLYTVRYRKNQDKDLDQRLRKVLEIFSKYHLHRILDIGCGDGSFSCCLKEAKRRRRCEFCLSTRARRS